MLLRIGFPRCFGWTKIQLLLFMRRGGSVVGCEVDGCDTGLVDEMVVVVEGTGSQSRMRGD